MSWPRSTTTDTDSLAGCAPVAVASARRRAAGSGGIAERTDSIHSASGHERHEVGLREVAVVVRILLRAQRVRPAVALVPVTGLLAHDLAGFDEVDLAARLVLDRPSERAHRVEVLDLAARAERLTGTAHADVGVDAHRAFLHLGVGGADGDEDARAAR